jgi:hypothetical protein
MELQYKKQYKKNKDIIRLTKYIEELKHFHTIYSAADDGEMTEDLMMYEQLIDWLEELKRYREGEYPYMADCIDED